MDLEQEFAERSRRGKYKITPQRLIVVKEIAAATDHPTAETLLHRIRKYEPRFALASVYRTINLLHKLGLILKHDFGDGKSRIEPVTSEHHNHLIDVENGKIIEFDDEEIDRLQRAIARRHGYRLLDYKLEIYAEPRPIGD